MGQILDPKAHLRANVADDILRAMAKKILGGNRDAAAGLWADVKEAKYTRQVARDLFPHVRRARIESCLFDLGSEFPGISVTSQLNSRRNYHHTKIRCGNVITTASAVLTPLAIVREAEFRNQYAGAQLRAEIDRDNNLSQVAINLSSPDELLYGIILYCPSENNRLQISSIHIGFPNWSCSSYIDHIDLLRLFPETITKTPVEEVQDRAIVELLLDEEELLLYPRETDG